MLKKTTVQAKLGSVIGADMVVEGSVKAIESIRVEGKVNGNVETEGVLTISATASVKGNVKGGSGVVVGGMLEGNLVCGGKTEVIATGKVFGDMLTRSLIVDEKAVFQGQCVMNEEEVSRQMQQKEAAKREEKTSKKEK